MVPIELKDHSKIFCNLGNNCCYIVSSIHLDLVAVFLFKSLPKKNLVSILFQNMYFPLAYKKDTKLN